MSNEPAEKWSELAAKVQAEVIAQDATDPDLPISGHQVKRALLHSRQDLVVVAALLTGLNQQAGVLNRTGRLIARLLWVVVVLLVLIVVGR